MLTRFPLPLNKNNFKCLKTNIESFDNLIGGGIPKGKIIELVGEPDIGKTKFLFNIIESLKNDEVIVAYIATSTKSLGFLKARGLSESNKLILCVTNDEIEIINFVKSTINVVDLFIIDSIPEILTENEKHDFDMSVNQDVPKLLRSLNTIMYGEEAALIAVNQMIYKNDGYVSRWKNIFQQYCTVRIEMYSDKEYKLLSHKLRPNLVGGVNNELRLG
jgi:predicted ATP-dependent serine protease|nr:MAG TPA: recA bacterial DNA recombination protein [Caudoviricetes sp.]